uniref:Uncharacterized protein n=1 Tax=Pipistrellus kuhlii TaxID=59472 RepID=A0A7J7RN30_PIPKU|nr:hypothetical protein mPipKuh1_010386 [Pipistrellus kuhlii]
MNPCLLFLTIGLRWPYFEPRVRPSTSRSPSGPGSPSPGASADPGEVVAAPAWLWALERGRALSTCGCVPAGSPGPTPMPFPISRSPCAPSCPPPGWLVWRVLVQAQVRVRLQAPEASTDSAPGYFSLAAPPSSQGQVRPLAVQMPWAL